MKCALCLASVVALVLVCGTAVAQDAAADRPKPAPPAAPDPASLVDVTDKAIRETAAAFAEAFNRGDAKAIAALWAADGDYVDESGASTKGQAAIEKKYADFFAQNPGAQVKIEIDALRALGAETVVEDGHAVVTLAPGGAATSGRYTAVHVRRDNKWQMACVRDMPAAQGTAGGTRADLEWLVGKWSAEHEGMHVDIDCRWIADKAFLEATYTVRRKDHDVSSSTQIIGTDPATGRVMAWMFDSQGGRAEGIWTAGPGGWSIELVGVTADGTFTTAVNYLTKVEDALVWKSLGRTAAGVALPDINEVVLKRTK